MQEALFNHGPLPTRTLCGGKRRWDGLHQDVHQVHSQGQEDRTRLHLALNAGRDWRVHRLVARDIGCELDRCH